MSITYNSLVASAVQQTPRSGLPIERGRGRPVHGLIIVRVRLVLEIGERGRHIGRILPDHALPELPGYVRLL